MLHLHKDINKGFKKCSLCSSLLYLSLSLNCVLKRNVYLYTRYGLCLDYVSYGKEDHLLAAITNDKCFILNANLL